MWAPEIPGYICISSSYLWSPSGITIGIFPNGLMSIPFTVLGQTLEGSKLSLCWPRCLITSCPAADISAPESGNTFTSFMPVDDEICTVMVGDGFPLLLPMLYNCTWSVSSSCKPNHIVLADVCPATVLGVLCWTCLLLHTLAKCPNLCNMSISDCKQGTACDLLFELFLHTLHNCLALLKVLPGVVCGSTATTFDPCSAISKQCFFAALRFWHFATVAVSVKFDIYSRFSIP